MTPERLAEALTEIEDLQRIVSENISYIHELGFEVTNLSIRLNYLKALIEGKSDEDIIHFRAAINHRMR